MRKNIFHKRKQKIESGTHAENHVYDISSQRQPQSTSSQKKQSFLSYNTNNDFVHSEGCRRDDSFDPEQQWKATHSQWNERFGWEEKPSKSNYWRSLRSRIMISFMLFAVTYGIMSYPVQWSTPIRQWLMKSLTEEMDFRPFAAWYERTFSGKPVFIPLFPKNDNSVQPIQARKAFVSPVKGEVVQSFSATMKHIVIAVTLPSFGEVNVHSAAAGKVEQVIPDNKEGISILLQHANGFRTEYVGITTSELQKNDWVDMGETIGTLSTGRLQRSSQNIDARSFLTFALKQGGTYIDPTDVISF